MSSKTNNRFIPFNSACESLGLSRYNADRLLSHYNSTQSSKNRIAKTVFNDDVFITEGALNKLDDFYKNGIISIAELERKTGIPSKDIEIMCGRCSNSVTERLPDHLKIKTYDLNGMLYFPAIYGDRSYGFANKYLEFQEAIDQIETEIQEELEKEELERQERLESETKSQQPSEEPEESTEIEEQEDEDEDLEEEDEEPEEDDKKKKDKGQERRKKEIEDSIAEGKRQSDAEALYQKKQDELKQEAIRKSEEVLAAKAREDEYRRVAERAQADANKLLNEIVSDASVIDSLAQQEQSLQSEIEKYTSLSQSGNSETQDNAAKELAILEEKQRKLREERETRERELQNKANEQARLQNIANQNTQSALSANEQQVVNYQHYVATTNAMRANEEAKIEYDAKKRQEQEAHAARIKEAVGDKYSDKTTIDVQNVVANNLIDALHENQKKYEEKQAELLHIVDEQAKAQREKENAAMLMRDDSIKVISSFGSQSTSLNDSEPTANTPSSTNVPPATNVPVGTPLTNPQSFVEPSPSIATPIAPQGASLPTYNDATSFALAIIDNATKNDEFRRQLETDYGNKGYGTVVITPPTDDGGYRIAYVGTNALRDETQIANNSIPLYTPSAFDAGNIMHSNNPASPSAIQNDIPIRTYNGKPENFVVVQPVINNPYTQITNPDSPPTPSTPQGSIYTSLLGGTNPYDYNSFVKSSGFTSQIPTFSRNTFSVDEGLSNIHSSVENKENLRVAAVDDKGQIIGYFSSNNDSPAVSVQEGGISLNIDKNKFDFQSKTPVPSATTDAQKGDRTRVNDTPTTDYNTHEDNEPKQTDKKAPLPSATADAQKSDKVGSKQTPSNISENVKTNKNGELVYVKDGKEVKLNLAVVTEEGKPVAFVRKEALRNLQNEDNDQAVFIKNNDVRPVTSSIDKNGGISLTEKKVSINNAVLVGVNGSAATVIFDDAGKPVTVLGLGGNIKDQAEAVKMAKNVRAMQTANGGMMPAPTLSKEALGSMLSGAGWGQTSKNNEVSGKISIGDKTFVFTFNKSNANEFNNLKLKVEEAIKNGKNPAEIMQTIDQSKFKTANIIHSGQVTNSQLRRGADSAMSGSLGGKRLSDTNELPPIDKLKEYNNLQTKFNIKQLSDSALGRASTYIARELAQTNTLEGLNNMYRTSKGITEAVSFIAHMTLPADAMVAKGVQSYLTNGGTAKNSVNIFVKSMEKRSITGLSNTNDIIRRMNDKLPDGEKIALIDESLGLNVRKAKVIKTGSANLTEFMKKEKIGDLSKLSSSDFDKLLSMDMPASLRRELLAHKSLNELLAKKGLNLSKMSDAEIAGLLATIKDKDVRKALSNRTGVLGLDASFRSDVVVDKKGLRGRASMKNPSIANAKRSIEQAVKIKTGIDISKYKTTAEMHKFLRDNKKLFKDDAELMELLQQYMSIQALEDGLRVALKGATARTLAVGMRRHLRTNESFKAMYDIMDIIHAMRQIHNVYHIGKKVVNKLRARSSSHLGKRIDKLHQKMNRSGLSDKRLSRLQKKSDNLTKKKDKLDKKVSKFEKKQNKTSPFAKLKEKRRESKLRRRNHRRDKFRNMIENSRFGQSKLGKKVLKKVGKARRAQLKALEKLAQMLQKIMQAIAKLKEIIATIGKYILLAIVIIILVVLLVNLMLFIIGSTGATVTNFFEEFFYDNVMDSHAGTNLYALTQYDVAFYGRIDEMQEQANQKGTLEKMYSKKVYGFIWPKDNGWFGWDQKDREEVTSVGAPYGKNGFVQIYKNSAGLKIARYSNAKDIICVGNAAFDGKLNWWDDDGATGFGGYCTNLWQSTHRCLICQDNAFIDYEGKTLAPKFEPAEGSQDFKSSIGSQLFANVKIKVKDFRQCGDIEVPVIEFLESDARDAVNAHTHLSYIYACGDGKCDGNTTNKYKYYCHAEHSKDTDQANTKWVFEVKKFDNSNAHLISPFEKSDNAHKYLCVIDNGDNAKCNVLKRNTDGCTKVYCEDTSLGTKTRYRPAVDGFKSVTGLGGLENVDNGRRVQLEIPYKYKTSTGNKVSCDSEHEAAVIYHGSPILSSGESCDNQVTIEHEDACAWCPSSIWYEVETDCETDCESGETTVSYGIKNTYIGYVLESSCPHKHSDKTKIYGTTNPNDLSSAQEVTLVKCKGYCPTHKSCAGHYAKCKGHADCFGHDMTFCIGHYDLKVEYQIIGINDRNSSGTKTNKIFAKSSSGEFNKNGVADVSKNYDENPNEFSDTYDAYEKKNKRSEGWYIATNTTAQSQARIAYATDWAERYNILFCDTSNYPTPLNQKEMQSITGNWYRKGNVSVVQLALESVARIPYHDDYWGGSNPPFIDVNNKNREISEQLEEAFDKSDETKQDERGRIMAGLNNKQFVIYVLHCCGFGTYNEDINTFFSSSKTYIAKNSGKQYFKDMGSASNVATFLRNNIEPGDILLKTSGGQPKLAIVISYPTTTSVRIVECSDSKMGSFLPSTVIYKTVDITTLDGKPYVGGYEFARKLND